MKNLTRLILIIFLVSACSSGPKRSVISLNGEWDIEEGPMNEAPENYSHKVIVPGLVSLAVPPFLNPGPKVKDRQSISQEDTLREAFWYRRTFELNDRVPESARLKVSKAMFGTRVLLNGKDLGEHLPCFTPGWFEVKNALKQGTNELIIRVGSSRNSVPASIPDGFDFEKERYIPGIFDNVELHLTGTPAILSVQVAPDINNSQVLIRTRFGVTEQEMDSDIRFRIREAKTGNIVAEATATVNFSSEPLHQKTIDISIPLRNCILWSPENPFLYALDVETSGDDYHTRFGMREFYYDTVKAIPVLNGKPYYLRGSNITLYRFFEDEACGALPWDTSWIRKLHRSFEQFHWNSIRYCIGLAPESWYDIADEEGILIQNEFPLWYGGKGWNIWPDELDSEELVKEYTEWMEEQWNHPSIVIWDASNETISHNGLTEEISEAVKIVREYDLSGRPWDNSYSNIRSPGDVMELHPYHFQMQSLN